ncbi:prenyltransferase and squalene oxidase repeat family protein [Babesia divergens]|uniref:Prenyltransferase and squalene oxidase repeat family protein n=1 Tax=Babesia divergens TaxID=32595 RepID=A0AAD9LEI3_BABDI|nr:prenyltransferase and squalene oxidase repeat family protein [Babesia divergens]
MSILEDRVLSRVRDAIEGLDACCANLSASSVQLASDGFTSISGDESDMLCKESCHILATYMTNLCKGCDSKEANRLCEGLEESIQSQALVEKGCAEIYSAVFAKYIMSEDDIFDESDIPVYKAEQCLSIDIRQLTIHRPAKRMLSILGDFSIADGYLRINVNCHGKTFLQKVGRVACHVCPLQREMHIQYIAKHLTLSGVAKIIPLEHLNCSQPWLVYWSLHSLSLLGANVLQYRERALQTLFECWDEESGGFGGGRGQIGHLATTYAAVCCLKMLGALSSLDICKLRNFILDMKHPDGSFSVHRGGERDVRGSYCAIATASMLGILDDRISSNAASRIASCQGYDGGISGEPCLESHAGYVYCGTAALKLLGCLEHIDTDRLRRWCLMRQTAQLGFQGRPHKLVDVCYSFWIGGTLALLGESPSSSYTLSNLMLRAYILCISQNPLGGFRDKPGKSVDLYHTCYALSALEIISHPAEASSLDVTLNLIY